MNRSAPVPVLPKVRLTVMPVRHIRLIAFGLLLGLLLLAAWLLPVSDGLRAALHWAQANPGYAGLIFTALYIVSALLMVPAILLTLAAGAMFGVTAGSMLVSMASFAGAMAAFLAGRTLARQPMHRLANRTHRFAALERAIRSRGFWMVLLIRLSPLFPYVLLNYLFSVSSVRWRDYAAGTWLGMLPAILLYVSIGAAASNLTVIFSGQAVTGGAGRTVLIAGLVVTVAVVVVITHIARRALQEQLIDE